MPVPFDPYHKWLGLSPFEDDPDVIASAADQRMGFLRNYQTGSYSELSQKLLNEVAAAKVSLLSPHKKAAYDARLRNAVGATAVEFVAPIFEPDTPRPLTGFPTLHKAADRRPEFGRSTCAGQTFRPDRRRREDRRARSWRRCPCAVRNRRARGPRLERRALPG